MMVLKDIQGKVKEAISRVNLDLVSNQDVQVVSAGMRLLNILEGIEADLQKLQKEAEKLPEGDHKGERIDE